MSSLARPAAQPALEVDAARRVPQPNSTPAGAAAGASASQSIFNLVKNIVGSGVLGLSAGLGAGTGLVPALFFSVLLGVVSGYTFSMLGRVCSVTSQKTFKDLGQVTSGPGVANTMTIVCTMKTFLTCVSYSIVIADSFSAILRGFGVEEPLSDRNTVLFTMMGILVTPMCCLKDLSLLAYTSLAGIAGMLYTMLFTVIRCFDGSYQPGGAYYASTRPDFRPDFAEGVNMFNINVKTLVLLCALSTAFIAHYNAPKFYFGLRDTTVARFNGVVFSSFFIALILFISIMLAGYFTFGVNTQGNVLNNYSHDDPLATIARLGVGLSTVFTYPLAFTGLRDGVLSLLALEKTNFVFYLVTGCLLGLLTCLAYIIHNLGFVNNFGGAVFGASIIYVFPAVLFFQANRRGFMQAGTLEKNLSVALAVIGLVFVVVGAVVAILAEFAPDALSPAAPPAPAPAPGPAPGPAWAKWLHHE